MENFKPRLFFFGDSFVQWPEPKVNHWTERFSHEYEVHRLGCNGSSNEHILLQLGVLPSYRPGDRIVVVLTEPFRLTKWMFGKHYSDYCDQRQRNHLTIDSQSTEFVKSMIEVNFNKDRLLQNRDIEYHESFQDTPLQVFNMLGMLRSKLSEYRPVYITWSEMINKYNLLPGMVTYIDRSDYTTNTEEGSENPHDYHPGEKGGKFWYDTVTELLDRWVPIDFTPHKVGTDYFRKGGELK